MQKPKIFLVGEDTTSLFPMEESSYDAERTLQEHLANTPNLIPGGQIDQENPRRWLLIKQEVGIPSEQNGGDFWSLDHLFVDQDCIPTFVECKRSSDPRLRREVAAQMLDYAANGMEYWPKGKMRTLAEETATAAGRDLSESIGELLQLGEASSEAEQDDFWQTVDDNLAKGCLRLLFVADAIPKELRRIIEFLNTKMSDVEVLGVELKQFITTEKGFKVFVPRIIGQLERTQAHKSTLKKKFTSVEDQLNIFPNKESFSQLISFAQEKKHVVGTGISAIPLKYPIKNKLCTYALCKPENSLLQFTTEYMKKQPDLKNIIEMTLKKNGYSYTGKYCFNIPVEETVDKPLSILTKVISALDDYTKTSQHA